MIAFLTVIYVVLLLLAFKLNILKPTLWWKLSPVVWILLLTVGLFIPMQFWAPQGPLLVGAHSVQIVPNVQGPVIEVAVAEDRVREALGVAREAGDRLGTGYAQWRLGTVLATRGSLAAALEALEQSFQVGQTLEHPQLRALTAQTLASLLVEVDREERGLAKRIEGLLQTSRKDALALDDVILRAPVLETLASYHRRFSPETKRAAEAMAAARRLLNSETREMSLSADSSNVIVARARRVALQPLLWTGL